MLWYPAILRFEYTYELSHKMLKRYFEMTEPNAEMIDQMLFPDLIRTASERGLCGYTKIFRSMAAIIKIGVIANMNIAGLNKIFQEN